MESGIKMSETLETKLCIWKVDAEVQRMNELEVKYKECLLCHGYDYACSNYVGETVLAVAPRC